MLVCVFLGALVVGGIRVRVACCISGFGFVPASVLGSAWVSGLVFWFGVIGRIHGCVLLLLCHLRIYFAKSSFGFALGNFVVALGFRKRCRLSHLRAVLGLVVVR